MALQFKDSIHPTIKELISESERIGKSMKRSGEIDPDLRNLKYQLGHAISSRSGFIGSLFMLQGRIFTCRRESDELRQKGKDRQASEELLKLGGLKKEFKRINDEAILLMDAKEGLEKIETKILEKIAERLKAQQEATQAEARQHDLNLGSPITKPAGMGGIYG